MRQLEVFEYEQQLYRCAAQICEQMAELLQLRDLVRLAEKRQGKSQGKTSIEWSSSQSAIENRRSVFPAVGLANVGAYPVLTKFLMVDQDSEILLSLAGVVDGQA
jgi:hypothetical protein